MDAVLTVNGVVTPVTPDHCLRFVIEGGAVRSVLYYQGKRVVMPWTISMVDLHQADKFGGNANTH